MSADVQPLGRWLILAGLVLIGFGVLLLLGPKSSWFGHLPGDLIIRREHVVVFLPLTSCLVASAVISLVIWVISRLR